MPKYFHFRANNIQFDSELQTHRCTATTANNHRCKNKVIFGLGFCWIHNRSQKHLQMKESNIPNAGTGVFAFLPNANNNTIVFHTGDIICPYDAEIVTNDVLHQRYGMHTAPYALKINHGLALDGALKRCIGSLINSSRTFAQSNCSFAVNNRTNTANIKATKNIKNGSELLLHYGNSYVMNEAGVRYSTNSKRNSI